MFGRSFIRNYGIRYTVFYINLFETSHAKGPQDAAAGFIKRQADIAVVRGNTIIQNAKDLFSFCNNDLKEPRSALFKRRIFRYVESVDRDNIRNFNLISNNRKIHHLYTSKGGEIVVSDLSCYTCGKCIVSDYEHYLHTDHTGQKRLVRPVEEPSNNADNEDNFECSENITELVSSDSVVAVKAEDDNIEYYMLRVTSGLETLSTTEKDSWGVEYPSGFQIF